MEPKPCQAIIFADAPAALTGLCGISILERLLRTLQRLGIRNVTIASATPELIRNHVTLPSWARAQLSVRVRDAFRKDETVEERTLILPAAYYDSRLLASLLAQKETTALVEHGRSCGAAVVEPGFAPAAVLANGAIHTLDLATEPSYVANMRRSIAPKCFPPPPPDRRAAAEEHIFDAAQNGTLDLPAIVHAPIETWIVRRLCRTSITPNQITTFTAAVSAFVVLFFASGRLVPGTLLGLVVGILDGLDGKQARVKVETTSLGQREHALDYLLELSWWTALAYHFRSDAWLVLLVASDLVDRLAKKQAKQLTGRNLDDVAPFDRFVRLIGGRRNIYVWIFAAGLLVGAGDKGFIALCCWGAVTAAVHVVRVAWLGWRGSECAAH